MARLERGIVQVYTGTGKGKTTAALGLALRCIGRGLKVYMVQFMKGCEYNEHDAIKKIDVFEFKCFGRAEFVDKKKPAKIDIEQARDGLRHAKDIINSGKYDVVILDELNVALDYKLVALEDVLELIENKPRHVELVLTGRYAPPELVRVAELVTEMLDIKHPYANGLQARAGIEH